MRYLLDTNICIHLIQDQPDAVVNALAKQALGDVGMSVITYAELCQGANQLDHRRRESAREALEALVRRVPVISYPPEAAQLYGTLSAGSNIRRSDVLDRLIASHAQAIGACLVTNDRALLKRYPSVRAENWTEL
jgi:tRNA(fMet)-specific endonuclease VapC